jgi:hypothetical protein
MMATEPPPPSGFPNFNQDFSFSGHSLQSFHPEGHSGDVDEVSWGAEGGSNNSSSNAEFHNGENSAEGPSPPNNWSQMPEKSIGFSNILSKLSAGASTPPLGPKDESDATTPLKFTKGEKLTKMQQAALNPTAKIYAPSPPVSPPFGPREGNVWSLDSNSNTGGGSLHNKQQQNSSPAPNNNWGGGGSGAWGGNNNNRQFDRNRGVRGGGSNNQPSTSFVIRPAEPSQEDRYECTRLPSGIVVQTHSGQAVEFWERVHVPRSMFDISGLGPNS